MPDASGFSDHAPPPESDEAAIARLAALAPLEYDRVRETQAERMGVRVATLDKQVSAARHEAAGETTLQGRALKIEPPEPWPEPVDGVKLLDALAAFYGRHASLPAHGATILTLWSAHTFCFEAARHTPRLAITSAEKGSGKTTILDLVAMTCCKPLSASSLTSAAMFRSVEIAKPTLLIDEADLFLNEAQDVRAILNAGNKHGGQVIRCVGDDSEPRAFSVHAPAAVAAIGRLPDTLTDRSVRLVMQRATAVERPARITVETERAGAMLARKAARWAADHADLNQDPAMPAALANRQADNWRILFAIAQRAGGDWPARVEAAALAETGGDAAESLGVALLRDLRAIYQQAARDRLTTAEIVRELVGMEDRPWPEMPGTGKAITAAWFTRRVKQYGADRTQWSEGGGRVWGFKLASFGDAFARYLPDSPEPPPQTGELVKSQRGTTNFPKPELVSPPPFTTSKLVKPEPFTTLESQKSQVSLGEHHFTSFSGGSGVSDRSGPWRGEV